MKRRQKKMQGWVFQVYTVPDSSMFSVNKTL